MFLSADLFARFCAAAAQTNEVDMTDWDDDPPSSSHMTATLCGTADLQLLHLYQFYLDLEDDMRMFDEHTEAQKASYLAALNMARESIRLLVAEVLADPMISTVMITRHGKIFECRNRRRHKKRPPYLRLLSQ